MVCLDVRAVLGNSLNVSFWKVRQGNQVQGTHFLSAVSYKFIFVGGVMDTHVFGAISDLSRLQKQVTSALNRRAQETRVARIVLRRDAALPADRYHLQMVVAGVVVTKALL